MTRRVFCASLLFLWVVTSVGRADDAPSLRVFFTGHSFHMFVPGRLGQMAKAADIKEYKLAGSQGLGGSRVDQHWNLPEEKNQAKKILEKAGTDVFTMAPHLKIPDEGIERFVELGLKNNPKMRFLVQQSWYPWDFSDKKITNNAQRDDVEPAKLRPDLQKWRELIETQVKGLNQKVGRDAVAIVPAGEAVVRLRELVAAGKAPGIAKQSELFTDPIGHGKAPLLLLVSYCNYTCVTGRNPVGLKVTEAGIGEQLNAILQRIAWETVTSYPMSGVKAAK